MANTKLTLSMEPDTDSVLEKFKETPIHPDILALSGILKGKYPDDITLWDAKYEYLKEKHGL